MEKNLQKIKEEYINLQEKLSQLSELSLTTQLPKNSSGSLDRREYGEMSKRFSFLQTIVDQINKKEVIEKAIKENEELLKTEEDKELQELAKEEISKLEKEKGKIENEIEKIIEKNESDKSSREML